MQLKAANMSSKGGDKAQQGMKKDIEKVQKRLADTETKLRNTSDEKLQLTTEKAVLERKAKVTEAQVSKLTKELEKKDGVCSRKITGVQEVRHQHTLCISIHHFSCAYIYVSWLHRPCVVHA